MARSRASAKKAGTAFETELSKYLTDKLGVPVKRRPKSGAVDLGDLIGVTHQGREISLECKSPGKDSPWSISEWWKETLTEAYNLGAPFGLLFVRRYRKSIGDTLVVVDEEAAQDLGLTEHLTVIQEKARGFKELAELLDKNNVIVSQRRGTDTSWYMTTVDSILALVDSAADADQIYLDEDMITQLQKEKRLTIPKTTGGVIVLHLRES